MSEQQFHQRLRAVVARHEGALTPELRRAARWAEQHPAAMCFHSLRALAAEADVSPASMSRLGRALGFSGFVALRAELRGALSEAAQAGYVERLDEQRRAGREKPALAERSRAQLRANAESAFSRNDAARYTRAAEQLLGARGVYFLGLRVSFGLAYHLNYCYGLVAPNGRLACDAGGTLADAFAGLSRADVLVSISLAPYTRQTVEATERARRDRVPIVAITDSPVSPIARGADTCLLFDFAAPSFFQSLVGAQAVIETLVAEVALQGGSKARRRLAAMERHFASVRAYWERSRRILR